MTKKLIVKKDNELITLLDEEEIQAKINDVNPGDVSILITYDDDTTETLHLRGHITSG